MDWLEAHKAKLDCYNKTFECLDEEGNLMVVQGFPKVISGRNSLAMQLEKLYGKGRRVYVAHVLEIEKNDTPRLEGFHMLQEVGNVLPDEILVKSDTNVTLELGLGVAIISQTPCRVSIPKMLKLKMLLQELQEKKYLRPSVFSWKTKSLVVKKKDDTL